MPIDQPPAIIETIRPQNFILSCGKGTVSIDLESGKVTLTNCELDDGAKAFWKAVEQSAPHSIVIDPPNNDLPDTSISRPR